MKFATVVVFLLPLFAPATAVRKTGDLVRVDGRAEGGDKLDRSERPLPQELPDRMQHQVEHSSNRLNPKYYCKQRCQLLAGHCGKTKVVGDAVVLKKDEKTLFRCPKEEECIQKTCHFFPTMKERMFCEDECDRAVHGGYCFLGCTERSFDRCMRDMCSPTPPVATEEVEGGQ